MAEEKHSRHRHLRHNPVRLLRIGVIQRPASHYSEEVINDLISLPQIKRIDEEICSDWIICRSSDFFDVVLPEAKETGRTRFHDFVDSSEIADDLFGSAFSELPDKP